MFSLSHRIHVWYDIFTYIWLIFMDIPYMDAMGMMDGKKTYSNTFHGDEFWVIWANYKKKHHFFRWPTGGVVVAVKFVRVFWIPWDSNPDQDTTPTQQNQYWDVQGT